MSHATFSIRDYDNKPSAHAINIDEPDATSLPDLPTDLDTYQTALDGIVLGNIAHRSVTILETVEGGEVPAGSVWAQRQAKWEVHYHDNVTLETYQLEIPCPDLTLLTANSKRMNITSGAGATWKAAFEAIHKSPTGGAVTVDFVQHVGRNLS